MKLFASFISVLAFLAIAPQASTRPNRQDKSVTTVKGEVVDLWCFMDHGGRGAGHKACAVACAKAGNPIGIVDAGGNVYVAMGSKTHQPAKELLIDHMADTVTVEGKLVKKGGNQFLYITSVK